MTKRDRTNSDRTNSDRTRSAIYVGQVDHDRLRPRRHRFRYGMAYLYLDLDELHTPAAALQPAPEPQHEPVPEPDALDLDLDLDVAPDPWRQPGESTPGTGDAQPGDAILVSGTLGDHGMAVLSKRENMDFGTTLLSDTASLHRLVARMLDAVPGIHVLRDPTRGGVATTLNEIAQQSGVGMLIAEKSLPIRPQVVAGCELLGLEPLYVANEGKLVAICPAEDAERLLATMRADPLGSGAAIVGSVGARDAHCFVQMYTTLGGMRIVDWLSGEQLPRIC